MMEHFQHIRQKERQTAWAGKEGVLPHNVVIVMAISSAVTVRSAFMSSMRKIFTRNQETVRAHKFVRMSKLTARRYMSMEVPCTA